MAQIVKCREIFFGAQIFIRAILYAFSISATHPHPTDIDQRFLTPRLGRHPLYICRDWIKADNSVQSFLFILCLCCRFLLHYLVSPSTLSALQRGVLQKPANWKQEDHRLEVRKNLQGRPVCNPMRCCRAGCAVSRKPSLWQDTAVSFNPKILFLQF